MSYYADIFGENNKTSIPKFIEEQNKKNKYVVIKRNENRKKFALRFTTIILTKRCTIYEDELATDFVNELIKRLIKFKTNCPFAFNDKLRALTQELYYINSKFTIDVAIHAQGKIDPFLPTEESFFEILSDPTLFKYRCPRYYKEYGFPDFLDPSRKIPSTSFSSRFSFAVTINQDIDLMLNYMLEITYDEFMDIKQVMRDYILLNLDKFRCESFSQSVEKIMKRVHAFRDEFLNKPPPRRPRVECMNQSLRAQCNLDDYYGNSCNPRIGCRTRKLQAQAWLDLVLPSLSLSINKQASDAVNNLSRSLQDHRVSHGLDEETHDKLTGLMGVFSDAAEKVKSTGSSLSGFRETINKLINTITGGIQIKFPQLDRLFDMLETVAKCAKDFVVIVLVFLIIKWLYWADFISWKTRMVINIIVGIVGLFHCFDINIMKNLMNCLYDLVDVPMTKMAYKLGHWAGDEDCLKANADVGSVDNKVDTFLVLLQSVALGKSFYYGEDFIHSFKKSINGWSRMKSDVVASMDTWMSLIQSFIDFLANRFGRNPVLVWEGRFPQLKHYVEAAQKFLIERQSNPVLTYDIGRDLERVQVLGREALNVLPISATNERVVHRAVTDSLKVWSDKLMKANFLGNGPRIKPLGVLFSGPSQIGKSEFNSVFVRSVMARLLPKSKLESYAMNPTSEIYNRIVEQEFWDGWRDQSAVTIDELGARRDAIGQNSEGFESIRLINGSNFNLHAAHLDEKGVLNARPMLVSATSNEIAFRFDGLRFMKAFENRYTAFAVLPKPEYVASDVSNRYDYEACRMKPLDTWLEEFEHLEFIEYDLTLAREKGDLMSAIIPNGKRFGALEMIDWAVEEITRLRNKGEMILKQHNKIIYKQATKRPDWEQVKSSFTSVEYEEFAKLYEKAKLLNETGEKPLVGQSGFQTPVVLFLTLLLTKFSTLFKGKDETLAMFSEYRSYKAQGGDLSMEDFLSLKEESEDRKQKVSKVKILKEEPTMCFDCKECVVCRAKHLSYDDLLSISNSTLWPGDSSNMLRHMAPMVMKGEELIPTLPSPNCLKLRKDVFSRGELIKFGTEDYAGLIYNHYLFIQKKIAEEQSSGLKNFIWSSLDNGKNLIKSAVENYKVIVPVVAALSAAVLAINHVMKKLYPESRSANSGKRRTKINAPKRRIETLQANSFCDGKISAMMSSVVNKNQWRVYAPDQVSFLGFATMIAGHVGFMPRHFAEILKNFDDEKGGKSIVKFVRALQPDKELYTEIPFSKFKFYDCSKTDTQDEDILFFQLPDRLLSRSKDIRDKFISEKAAPSTNFRGALWKPDVSTKTARIDTYDSVVVPNQTSSYYSSMFNLFDESPYVATNAFRYDAPTEVGDCGSLLTRITNVGSNGRILGMHVAGSKSGYGISIPVYREMVDDAFEFFYGNQKSFNDEDVVMEKPLDATLVANANLVPGFTYLGETKGPRTPTRTKILKSPLYEKISPCALEPVKMHKHKDENGDVIDPVEQSRAIYSHHVKYIDDEILEACVKDTINSINRSSRKTHFEGHGLGPKRLSVEEAIWGVEGHDYLSGLKSSSSPGYSYCLRNPQPGTKKHWVGEEGRPDVLTGPMKELINDIEVILEKANKGVRSEIVFTDFLKDETRKKGKAARPISGANQAYLGACNVEFGALSEYLLLNRIDNGFTIGINAFGDEWNYLYSYLKMNQKGKNWVDGDFKNFDASHTRQLLMTFKDLCDDFYGNTSEARDTLLEDLANSIHISEGKVYMWDCSLPSGHPLTSIINCWINLVINKVAFVLTYIRKFPGVDKEDAINEALALYNDEVRSIVYGDDNVHWVGEQAKKILNIKEHSTSMAEIGYIYTDANKRTDVTEFKEASEISFLKRKFRKHEKLGRIVAPLDFESLNNSLQWIKQNDIDKNDFRNKITTVLLEASFHPEEEFDRFSKKVLRESKVINYVPIYNNYAAYARANAGRQEFI